MNELERTLTSNEVAEMIGKRHSDLLKDIRTYINYLNEGKIPSVDFFAESTYKDSKNEERPNFLLTKQGCEMVSNKLTGAKGVHFTAKYVSRFNKMENHIKQQQLDTSNLSPELQMFNGLFQSLAKQELATKQLENKVDNISEIVALNSRDWRKKVNSILQRIAIVQGGFNKYSEMRNESYQLLENRGKCNLDRRLENRRKNMIVQGVGKSTVKRLNKLDIIAEDTRLTEIYLSVVKDMAIKYQVNSEEIA